MTYPHAALHAADDTLRPHLPAVGVLEVARNHLHGVTVLLSNATAAAELARALGIPDGHRRREHHTGYVTDTWRGHLAGVPVTVHATTLTYTRRERNGGVSAQRTTRACHVEMWTENYRDWGWRCFTCLTESTTTFPDLAEAERAATDHEEGR